MELLDHDCRLAADAPVEQERRARDGAHGVSVDRDTLDGWSGRLDLLRSRAAAS